MGFLSCFLTLIMGGAENGRTPWVGVGDYVGDGDIGGDGGWIGDDND
jgi:hypothetical protein